MTKHVRVVHEGIRFSCFLCGNVFKSVYGLRKRLKNKNIHNFKKEIDSKITEVRINQDDLSLTKEASDKLICLLRKKNESLTTQLKKLNEENESLRKSNKNGKK